MISKFISMFSEPKIYEYILPSPSPSYNLDSPEILMIPTKTSEIPCFFFPTSPKTKSLDPTHQICLFFHGNGEDIGHSVYLLPEIQENIKLDFLAIEYPGYGIYEAKKSIIKMKEDALQIYDYLINKLNFPQKNILVMGRSIGSGPAVYLTSHRRVAAVIIISGFSSLEKFIQEIFGRRFPNFKFDNEEENFNNLKEVEEIQDAICWIHGKEDNLIKIEHAMEVEEKLKNKENFHPFYRELMSHNSFNEKTDICDSINIFLKKIGFQLL